MGRIHFIVSALSLWLMLLLSGQAQEASCVLLIKEINNTYVYTGDIDAPLQACTRIIEAGQAGKADMAKAHAYRASIYLVKDDLAAADKDASAALALDPDHSPAHIARAQVLFRKGAWDKALLETNAALKLDPANDWIYNHRGILENNFALTGAAGVPVIGDIVVADPGRWVTRALGDFNQAEKLNPAEPGFHINACKARALWGKELENALAECDQAAAMAATLGAATTLAGGLVLESLCIVKFRMKKYAEAIADCSAALKINPKRSESLYVRGLALNQTGQSGAGDIAAAKDIDRNVDIVYGIFGVTP